jgi:hypothetical protein
LTSLLGCGSIDGREVKFLWDDKTELPTLAQTRTLMSEIDIPSLKERLWQKMQGDLAQFVPEVVDRNRLMCCACGRFRDT